ncbi:MAG TPA: xanthine dehydrogenase family protein subunit M [Patescibacteria group bacterium]|nr:xanthine dehydrogenase family protein subunit M [Patescibacteria group bacterium]
MIPATFAYERASTVDEALSLLMEDGADAKLIAGGQSLLPLMKLRLARPDRLIDIGRIESLRGVRQTSDGRLAIGALTTYAQLLDEPTIMGLALMADALPRIADVQVRNRGTIGGAIAHADPAADMPAVLLALEAEVVARSAHHGERTIPIGEFFDGAFSTALAPDELLTEIRVPAPSGSYGSAYRMLEQPASGFAIAGVAAVIGQTGGSSRDAEIDDVRVAVTGVGEKPFRATSVEDALRGTKLGSAAIGAAVASICDGVSVQSDIHADRTYRSAMAVVMAKRALESARERLFE